MLIETHAEHTPSIETLTWFGARPQLGEDEQF